MAEFLKMLLFLNVQGSVLVMLLLLLKRVIAKSFSGKWQRNLWIFATVVFLLPVWKLVPENTTLPIVLPYYSEDFTYEQEWLEEDIDKGEEGSLKSDTVVVVEEIDLSPVIFCVWGTVAGLFLVANIGGYIIFLVKKRKGSENLEDDIFSDVMQSMDIRRKMRLRRCDDDDSPMLTGVLFPVVYVPKRSFTENELRYVYSHELTHYKHKDLALKWLVCVINSINWFNPCMYFVIKSLNEACEIYCDETVTKNMDHEGKRQYMDTILNLVVKKGENNV